MKFTPTLHKLSNGITVLLDPMDTETVCMKIHVSGGTRIESPAEYGITHFIEHMHFAGTKKYPTTKSLNDTLADYGGTFGGTTYRNKTTYQGRILAENLDVLVDVLSELILNSNFEQKYIDREKTVVTQEINRSIDDQARQFNGLVCANIFPDSYLAKYDGLGKIETINAFTRDQLMSYKADKYTANNIIIGLSGLLGDQTKLLDNLERRFGGIKSGNEYTADPGHLHPCVIYNVREDKKQTRLFIGFEDRLPDERKFDYEGLCVGAFESVLGQRIIEEIRNNKGLVYSCGLAAYGDRILSAQGFMTALSPENLSEVIASLASKSYDILHRNPITRAELNRKNTMIKLSRADFFESSTGRLNKLVAFYAEYGDVYDPSEFDEMRKRLTIEDVMKNSANYFTPPINIIAQGPKCDIDMKSIWDENFK